MPFCLFDVQPHTTVLIWIESSQEDCMHLLFLSFFAVVLFSLTGILGKVMYHHNDSLFSYTTFHSYSSNNESLKGSFFLKTFFPSVFIVLLAWVLQITQFEQLINNIWLIVVFYWCFRLFWLLCIFNMSSLINYGYEFVSLVVSIGTAFGVYNIFISYCVQNGISVFLSRDELRSGIAFAIFLYTVDIIWKIINANGVFSRKKIYNDKMIIADLEKRTKKLFNRYGTIVKDAFLGQLDEKLFFDKEYFLTTLLFSIMIVEDRNRPFFVRKFENLLHRTIKRNKSMTVGIMQVTSIKPINDKESILEATFLISRVLQEFENDSEIVDYDDYQVMWRVINNYNSSIDYFSDIDYNFETIGQWLDITVG